MKRKDGLSKELLIRVSIKEFGIPPVKDGLVLGRNSPIEWHGQAAKSRRGQTLPAGALSPF